MSKTKTEATTRPPIQMLESEAERLTDLAISVQDRLPEVSALLIQEIGRAKMHAADRIPADVVTMCRATFRLRKRDKQDENPAFRDWRRA